MIDWRSDWIDPGNDSVHSPEYRPPEPQYKPVSNDQEAYNLIGSILREEITTDDKLRKDLHLSTARAYKNAIGQVPIPDNPELKDMKAFAEFWIRDALNRYNQSAPENPLPDQALVRGIFLKVMHRGVGPAKVVQKLGPP